MFVARIHNNSLGSCIEVDSFDTGVKIIKKLVQESSLRLDDDDIWKIEEIGEYHNFDDSDNYVSFCIGMLNEENFN